MSSEALPISPARFASALKDLPMSTLHLKAAEIRNSIAHLDYSNEEMKPFAEGRAPECVNGEKDQDCVDAIKENELVIERMVERLNMLKAEVEERGGVWGEFDKPAEGEVEGEALVNGAVNGESNPNVGAGAATNGDGTFTTGRIVGGEVVMDGAAAGTNVSANATSVSNATANGESRSNGTTGGRLDDEALRRAMEERMREAMGDDDEEGMHL
ncbi:secondary alcohol dehydrogenase protein [Rutstroemia sp. NJR-2017a BBW]|nr:secondary alcohol dehydrogenase protein [Rutstroemia sp. NJR-2017a BBW]